MLGAPLLRMERGKGSTLDARWPRSSSGPSHRIAARLSPMLDSLASELQAEIERVVMSVPALLRIHASHGFAIEALHAALGRGRHRHRAASYCGEPGGGRVAARLGACEIAGFHVPTRGIRGAIAGRALRAVAQAARTQKLIGIATRRLKA